MQSLEQYSPAVCYKDQYKDLECCSVENAIFQSAKQCPKLSVKTIIKLTIISQLQPKDL